MARRSSQLPLPERKGPGGPRKGAGRKPTRPGSWVAHSMRPRHDRHHPVHVTLRVQRGIPHLRRFHMATALRRSFRAVALLTGDEFRVVHYSIQHNHLHFLVEARDRGALSRGMKGLGCRLAKGINRSVERTGPVFADRYHAHTLTKPLEVRNALRYLLLNGYKHQSHDPIPDPETALHDGLDPCSSAPWFDGWQRPPPALADPPVASARTWLLRTGWRRHGLLRRPG